MADMTPQEAVKYLAGMRVFVTSRERAKKPEGEALFDDAIRVIDAHLAGMGELVLIGWLEAEPSATPESLAVYGQFLHSTMVHIGAKRPEKLQERNGMFPLYLAAPASGDWDKVREVIPRLREQPFVDMDIDRRTELADKLTAALPESQP